MILVIAKVLFIMSLVVTTVLHFVCKNNLVKKSMYYIVVSLALIQGVASCLDNSTVSFLLVLIIILCALGYPIYMCIPKLKSELDTYKKNNKGKHMFFRIIIIVELLFMIAIKILEYNYMYDLKILFALEKVVSVFLIFSILGYIRMFMTSKTRLEE